jgi:hypothetical protein
VKRPQLLAFSQLRRYLSLSRLLRLGIMDVASLRALLRLLTVVSAVFLLTAEPLGVHAPTTNVSFLESHERDVAASRTGDLVTRKQHRRAASLEEFFAIDDDSDQYTPSSARIVAAAFTWSVPLAVPCSPVRYRDALPSHRPCAGTQTGPPTS